MQLQFIVGEGGLRLRSSNRLEEEIAQSYSGGYLVLKILYEHMYMELWESELVSGG